MPWWLWVLLVWSALAVVLGTVIGLAIRAADQWESRTDRNEERDDDDEEPDGRRRPRAS